MRKFVAPLFAVIALLFYSASCTKKEDPGKPNNPENVNPVAHAGIDVIIKPRQDSVLLTGTATDSDGQIVSYVWRKLSGSETATIKDSTSASTVVNGLAIGNYTFQLQATDNDGATAFDTMNIEVVTPDTLPMSQQPHNNRTEVHLFGSSTINETDTIAPEIAGGSGTTGGTKVDIRALLQFDLNDIPSYSTIISAKLTLYSNPTPLNGQDGNPNYGSDNALLIQRVTDEWTYSAVNWLNQPDATTEGQIEIPHTNEPKLDLVDIDVKDLIQQMVDKGNHGFLIRLKNEQVFNWRIFCSSKYSDPTLHPKLEVVYTK